MFVVTWGVISARLAMLVSSPGEVWVNWIAQLPQINKAVIAANDRIRLARSVLVNGP